MVPLIGSRANTAWSGKSIIHSYVGAGHATWARAAAFYKAVRHMQFQYDNPGRSVSVHVELAQRVETQLLRLQLVQNFRFSRSRH